MRFGVCCSVDQAVAVQQAGFDYAELPFRDWASQSEADFQENRAKIGALGDFRAEAMNVMLPASARLTGRNPVFAPVLEFLEKGFCRASAVGTKIVVFGSGASRSLPEGFADRAAAYDQLEEFLRLAGKRAEPYGIHIVIEPLSFRETNIVNLIPEAAYLAGRVGRENVRCLADYFHVAANRESCGDVVACAGWIKHCHIACPRGRAIPLPEDGWDYAPFFDALKTSGYDCRVSVEGSVPWKDRPEKTLAESLRYMKACAGQSCS